MPPRRKAVAKKQATQFFSEYLPQLNVPKTLPARPANMPALTDLPLEEFIDELSSGKPAPGSGSAAALAGAISAALLKSHAVLTRSKVEKKKKASHIAARYALENMPRRITRLMSLIERDAVAFREVVRFRSIAKKAEDTKAQVRFEKIAGEKLRRATELILQIGELCASQCDLALRLSRTGYRAARGESILAFNLAYGTGHAVADIAEINLEKFYDQWADDKRAEIAKLRTRLDGGWAKIRLPTSAKSKSVPTQIASSNGKSLI